MELEHSVVGKVELEVAAHPRPTLGWNEALARWRAERNPVLCEFPEQRTITAVVEQNDLVAYHRAPAWTLEQTAEHLRGLGHQVLGVDTERDWVLVSAPRVAEDTE